MGLRGKGGRGEGNRMGDIQNALRTCMKVTLCSPVYKIVKKKEERKESVCVRGTQKDSKKRPGNLDDVKV